MGPRIPVQKKEIKKEIKKDMSGVIWTLWFLGCQGFKVNKNIVYQYNQSAILMESNRKYSCGKKTHHIDMRYFFIADHIEQKEVSVEYCPTEEISGDNFTKPLQGALFRQHRATIMNL